MLELLSRIFNEINFFFFIVIVMSKIDMNFSRVFANNIKETSSSI